MPLPVLNAAEQRVLGALLEKQLTVPASYPLSVNALRVACNQTSSREPVVDYTENDVSETTRALKDRGLVRLIWTGKGSRVVKYHQLLDEILTPTPAERALLTVLLLRGAQTAGELKARSERLHPFDDKAAVSACLDELSRATPPLVEELPAGRGQQESRWIHLLGPVSTSTQPDSAQPDGADPRELVLADGAATRDARVVAAYNTVAAQYSEALLDELAGKPFDAWLLRRIAAEAGGPIVEVGCGPGQVAAFLASAGAEAHGIDASPAMIAQARKNFGDLTFTVSRFDQLLRPPNAAAWGAIVAWYAFVHLAPSELAATVESLAATLRPAGLLALAVHTGDGIVHSDELFGVPVDIDFVTHDPEAVIAAVTAAGLDIVEWYLRSPVPTEAQTRRLYLLARRR